MAWMASIRSEWLPCGQPGVVSDQLLSCVPLQHCTTPRQVPTTYRATAS